MGRCILIFRHTFRLSPNKFPVLPYLKESLYSLFRYLLYRPYHLYSWCVCTLRTKCVGRGVCSEVPGTFPCTLCMGFPCTLCMGRIHSVNLMAQSPFRLFICHTLASVCYVFCAYVAYVTCLFHTQCVGSRHLSKWHPPPLL